MNNKENDRLVGLRIRDLRKSLNMRQADLAKKIKLTQPNLSRIEHGEVSAMKYINQLAVALGTRIEYLVNGDVYLERHLELKPAHSPPPPPPPPPPNNSCNIHNALVTLTRSTNSIENLKIKEIVNELINELMIPDVDDKVIDKKINAITSLLSLSM